MHLSWPQWITSLGRADAYISAPEYPSCRLTTALLDTHASRAWKLRNSFPWYALLISLETRLFAPNTYWELEPMSGFQRLRLRPFIRFAQLISAMWTWISLRLHTKVTVLVRWNIGLRRSMGFGSLVEFVRRCIGLSMTFLRSFAHQSHHLLDLLAYWVYVTFSNFNYLRLRFYMRIALGKDMYKVKICYGYCG